jgi:ABC-type antimicrobial peptide transport system permease subunit
VVDGAPLTPGTPGVMISETAAENGDYAVGDEIAVQAGACLVTAAVVPASDPAAECEAVLPVVGIFALPAQMAEAQIPPDVAALFWQDLAALEGLSLQGKPVPNAFYVLADANDPTAREVDDLIDQINTTLLDQGITASFVNMVEIADMASDAILSIGVILNLASLVMAAVGAIGLITTLSIAVFERQKEIGVMRSIGAGSGTIATQFLVEGIVIGVLAWLLAVPLSYGLAQLLLDGLGFAEFIEFHYPLWVLLMGLIGMVVIATIASLWPSLAAARRTVSDILRYQ